MIPSPSVGRIVHYVSHGTPIRKDGSQAYQSVCRAAVITEVGAWIRKIVQAPYTKDDVKLREVTEQWHPDACVIEVHNPTGLFFNTCEHHEPADDGDLVPGTWHWPERV